MLQNSIYSTHVRCQVIIKAPNRFQHTNIPTVPINMPEILAARELTSLLFDSYPAESTKKAGSSFSKAVPAYFLMVRPAGFEPAAYGFEEQESCNSKMSWFQTVDSIQLFQPTFGFVWKHLEIFDLDGHNLGTVLNDRFPPTSAFRKNWKRLIRMIYKTYLLTCPDAMTGCRLSLASRMGKWIKILKHLDLWNVRPKPPPYANPPADQLRPLSSVMNPHRPARMIQLCS